MTTSFVSEAARYKTKEDSLFPRQSCFRLFVFSLDQKLHYDGEKATSFLAVRFRHLCVGYLFQHASQDSNHNCIFSTCILVRFFFSPYLFFVFQEPPTVEKQKDFNKKQLGKWHFNGGSHASWTPWQLVPGPCTFPADRKGCACSEKRESLSKSLWRESAFRSVRNRSPMGGKRSCSCCWNWSWCRWCCRRRRRRLRNRVHTSFPQFLFRFRIENKMNLRFTWTPQVRESPAPGASGRFPSAGGRASN